MSDPFWDELNSSLPRIHRGASGWTQQRARVQSLLRGGQQAPRRLAGVLAAGLAAAALFLIVQTRSTKPPDFPSASMMPTEELDFLESTPLLEHLDELLNSPELDQA